MNEQLEEVVEFISELEDDHNVPRNIKAKLADIMKRLKSASQQELSLTINKLLCDLDDISNDANLDSFTRQQIWSISSMLEAIETA